MNIGYFPMKKSTNFQQFTTFFFGDGYSLLKLLPWMANGAFAFRQNHVKSLLIAGFRSAGVMKRQTFNQCKFLKNEEFSNEKGAGS
jgi:hypothetical protein